MAETATPPIETKTDDQSTKPPQRAYRPGFDQPPVKPMTVEDDPNHKMQMLLSNRTRKAEPGEKTDEAKTEVKDEKIEGAQGKTEEKAQPAALSGLATLISQQLKFRDRKDDKTGEKAKEEVKTEDKKPEKAAETKADEKKTVVTKKAPAATSADPLRMAAEAAGAAAGEAVRAAMSKVPSQQAASRDPEEEVGDDYRRDYEVAKHLAEIDPRYKDAPQYILGEQARVAEYASNWEARNPGKVFNPKDEEHNEFYAAIERPWSDDEFIDARADMIAERKFEAKAAKLEQKTKAVEEREAKRELAVTAAQTVNTVALLLAKNVNEAAHDLITKDPEGFKKLQESDPITADALVEALDRLSPRIQTAIFVDDPHRRIAFNHKDNPDQAEWLRYLYEKEAQYAGQPDERGRIFASRTEYVKLTPEQQARRWYLSPDHLISEMVADTIQEVKAKVEKERERGKKIASALGYVPKPEKNGSSGKDEHKTDASSEDKSKKSDSSTSADGKPISPSVGSGAKIDSQGDGKKTPHDDLWARTGKILFGR